MLLAVQWYVSKNTVGTLFVHYVSKHAVGTLLVKESWNVLHIFQWLYISR